MFASRVFRHGFIVVNRNFVKSPADLAGKRIGVPLYTQTAALFVRGLMQHDLGVDLAGIEWVQGAVNEPGAYGNPAVMPLLKPVKITPNQTGKSLSDLLGDRRDPRHHRLEPAARAQAPSRRGAAVSRLPRPRAGLFPPHAHFPDHASRSSSATTSTSGIPRSRRASTRRSCAAKDRAWEKMRYAGTLRYMLPWLPDDVEEIDELFGGDCWPYGVEPNRPTLEALVTYMAEQGLIPAPIPIEKLFVPVGD